ncbi:MAG: hypothetical protein M1812_003572 [Candelaria pacifica]|nr:MAG: hypothetical protein M1812_003572 [Candelaria pacifica]
MRVTESQSTTKIETLQAENAALVRQLAIAQGRERAAYTSVRKTEAAAKNLRDEMTRLKIVLSQVRTSCANDIRKRDVQISRLKGQLTTQQRGTRQPLSASTITITPGIMGGSQTSMGGSYGGAGSKREQEIASLDSPDYSLRQETTEFLTSLSQSLSDENDSLIALVRESLATLRSMQGLPVDERTSAEIHGHGESSNSEEGPQVAHTQTLPNHDTLATEMHTVMDHLRSLLTNPSFVPIEEVEAREDEIVRLREGWEKMEERWREVVGMMDGWRKRMAKGGQVQMEELKMGLGLGVGLNDVVTQEDKGAEWEDEERNGVEEEHPAEFDSGTFKTETSQEELSATASPQSTDQTPEEAAEDSTILRETDNNSRPSPQKLSFNTSPTPTPSPSPSNLTSNTSTPTPLPKPHPHQKSPSLKHPTSTASKPKRNQPTTIPKTIPEKLASAKHEAEKAAERKIIDTSQSSTTTSTTTTTKKNMSNGERTRRKRKSTLTSEELERLICGV